MSAMLRPLDRPVDEVVDLDQDLVVAAAFPGAMVHGVEIVDVEQPLDRKLYDQGIQQYPAVLRLLLAGERRSTQDFSLSHLSASIVSLPASMVAGARVGGNAARAFILANSTEVHA